MATSSSMHQRCVTILVCSCHICSTVHQQFGHCIMATSSSMHQRCPTILVCSCHICPMIQQQCGHCLMATTSSNHQRCGTLAVCSCHICPTVQQQFGHCFMATSSSMHQQFGQPGGSLQGRNLRIYLCKLLLRKERATLTAFGSCCMSIIHQVKLQHSSWQQWLTVQLKFSAGVCDHVCGTLSVKLERESKMGADANKHVLFTNIGNLFPNAYLVFVKWSLCLGCWHLPQRSVYGLQHGFHDSGVGSAGCEALGSWKRTQVTNQLKGPIQIFQAGDLEEAPYSFEGVDLFVQNHDCATLCLRQCCIEWALFGILPDLVSHSVLVECKKTNPKDYRFGRILANALETHLGPTLQCCHRLTEKVAPEMRHKAVDNETMFVDEFRERSCVQCWRHAAHSILITSWTVAGSWHGSHHIAVHGVEVGCLTKLLLLHDGICVFQVESFALRRQPSGVDEQILQVLQLPQCHAS